jgi:hypothetical protein
MKLKIRFLVTLVFILGIFSCFSTPSHAQSALPVTRLWKWSTPTTTGQLGNYIILASPGSGPAFGNYSIDWSESGTAPAVCTFRVEGSSDNVNWYGLDVTSPSTTSCTTSGLESIAYKPIPYVRINIVAFTAGDGTTVVNFHFTGGRE